MLIVCNGAYKNGSTWIYTIVRQGIRPEPIPGEFQMGGKWNGASIPEERLKVFLDSVDYRSKNFVVKAHWDRDETLETILAYDLVFVVNIARDLRDVIVSAYYHHQRENASSVSFADYYWEHGRNLAGYIYRYHQLWRARPGKVCVSSYEKLMKNFAEEVRRVFRFVGVTLDDRDILRLWDRTTLAALRRTRGENGLKPEERFFRKGIIGDWQNHFTPEIAADFQGLEEAYGHHHACPP